MSQCICCDERPAMWMTQTARHCYTCNDLVGKEPDLSDAWPIQFGRAISRFAILTRIDELVYRINEKVMFAAYYSKQPEQGYAVAAVNNAADELAAMARAGHK